MNLLLPRFGLALLLAAAVALALSSCQQPAITTTVTLPPVTPEPTATADLMDIIEQAIVARLAQEGRRVKARFGLLASPVFAQGIKYEFDEVEVRYAAEFDATPVNMKETNWLVQLAGGPDKPVKVVYGVVLLKKGQQVLEFKEEFIKVIGENNSDRFLMNGGLWSFYETTGTLKFSHTEFSSHKKVEGTAVVKDFTPPLRLIYLSRELDQNGQLAGLVLSALQVNDLREDRFNAWTPVGSNEYYGNLASLIQAGEPTAISK